MVEDCLQNFKRQVLLVKLKQSMSIERLFSSTTDPTDMASWSHDSQNGNMEQYTIQSNENLPKS